MEASASRASLHKVPELGLVQAHVAYPRLCVPRQAVIVGADIDDLAGTTEQPVNEVGSVAVTDLSEVRSSPLLVSSPLTRHDVQ
jgi:hypothetical protein